MLFESLLEKVAESAFNYLLEQSQHAEGLRARLGRDPERLAFQVALAHASATFSRNHPQWAASPRGPVWNPLIPPGTVDTCPAPV